MIRQSFYTFFNRSFIAILNFITVVFTAHFLGAEGRGIISLFVLNLTITLMINNFVGGPGLVYLFPRQDATRLLSASYLWAIFCAITVSYILYFLKLVDTDHLFDLVMLSVIHALLRIQLSYLLGIQKIKQHNLISLIYPALLLLSLLYSFKIKFVQNVDEYFVAFYISLISSLVISSIITYQYAAIKFSFDLQAVFKSAILLGFVFQCANILQLLNYRFSYILLDTYYTKHEVGLYSTAISFAEAVWVIANSFAIIQYSKISNSKDDSYNVSITVKIIRIVMILTFFALLLLLALPSAFFVWMLGNDFARLKSLLPWLAPGILMLVINIIISHYYSGSGKPIMALLGSGAGFAVTLCAGYLLIPVIGLKGAAVTATLSYFISSALLLVIFMKQKKLPVKEFIPTIKDFLFWKEKLV